LEGAVCGATIEGAVALGIIDPFGNLDLSTIQATSHAIGIRADGNKFVPMIPKNTRIPACKDKLFTTIYDTQTATLILVYEENQLLGYFKITGIPAARKGVPEINMGMDINAANVLRVLAGVVLRVFP